MVTDAQDFSDIEVQVEDESNSSSEQPQSVTVPLTSELNFDALIKKLSSEIDISNVDFQNDKMAGNVQRTMLANLLRLLPISVDAYRKKPTMSTATALTGLIKQANELFEQIRTVQNLDNQVQYITEEIVQPMIKFFIANLFDAVFYAKKSIQQDPRFMNNPNDLNCVNREFDNMIKNVGTKMEQAEETAIDKLKQYLLEV